MGTCPLCLNSAQVTRSSTGFKYNVFCEVCGEYSISYPVADSDELQYHEKRYILSAVARIRYEQGKEPLEILTLTDMNTILDSVPEPSASEQIDLLLKHLHRKQPDRYKYVPLNARTDYPILYAKNPDEFRYVLEQARDTRGYIKQDSEVQQRSNYHRLSLKGWDRLDELDKQAEQEPSREIELGETERFWDGIRGEIEASSLEEDFKEVALYDLEQAKLAYRSGAFKACIVMLGAVLEGLMLGTIRRREVLQIIKTDPPKVVKSLGLQDPRLADKMAGELGFEDYKNIIHHLMPDIEKLQVEGIQTFRNAIHPWKVTKEPIYANPDQTRTIHHLTSLELLARYILSWTP